MDKREQEERARQLEALVGHLLGWKGELIKIHEYLSRVPGSFDRHHATHSALVMELESVGINFSGFALALRGCISEQYVSYQVSCDWLAEIKLKTNEVELIERFSKGIERLSQIRPLVQPPA